MKKLLIAAIISALCVSMIGCTSETQYGECVGVDDDHNPAYIYRTPANNIIVGVFFSETVIVPVWVLLKEFSCPVAKH